MMKKTPIILIPGIQGTKLTNINEKDFKVLWSGVRKFFSNIHQLALQKDGVSDVKEEVLVERADVENMAYSEIINYLRELGYQVYIFGYDWRKSNVDSAKDLEIYVEKLKRKLETEKVSFVTHSMGALVLSVYLKSLFNKEKINQTIGKIVFANPPFLGSVEATFNLVIGKSRLFNSSDDFRKVGRTFPGIYELLPVFKGAYEFEGGQKLKDFYDYDKFWQQKYEQKHDSGIVKHRLKYLGGIRTQDNLLFNLSQLDASVRDRMIVLAGGGEETKNKVVIKKDSNSHKFLFDFCTDGDKENGGDGTVPLESSTIFNKSIDTYKVDTTYFEKRLDSKFIQSDWHAFFLNNARVQNVIKRFLDPEFTNGKDWYQSVDKSIKKV